MPGKAMATIKPAATGSHTHSVTTSAEHARHASHGRDMGKPATSGDSNNASAPNPALKHLPVSGAKSGKGPGDMGGSC